MLASLTNCIIRRWGAVAALGPLALMPLVTAGLLPEARAQQAFTTTVPANAAAMELKVRRVRDGVEVVIENTGTGPQLEQSSQGGSWLGRLTTTRPAVLLRGPQVVAVPEAGIASISLEGGGTVFNLRVTPAAGYPVRQPLVSADGRNVVLSFQGQVQPPEQTLRRNSLAPGAVANPNWAPPLRQRASAPPVGDMAVGTMLLRNSGFVNASGPPVTMTLKNAPAQAALMALARMGGYSFAYVNDSNAQATQGSGNAGAPRGPATTGGATRPNTVTVSFRNENYGRALNSTLLAAGLQGKLEGRTLLVGTNVLGKSFGAQLSKVYRLNQVAANSAADYLANLGAQVTKTNTITTAVSEGVASTAAPAASPTASTTTSSTTTIVEAYGASTGPLLGLQATTDSRLSTITLVGSPAVVAVAERYLKQLDLRQRQVALSVRILDVSLRNDADTYNSFAFRWGNNFIVNDNGTLAANFGSLLGGASPQFPLDTPLLTGTRSPLQGYRGPDFPLEGYRGNANPGMGYPRDNFFDFLQARIFADNTKVLASPTLILQEDPSIVRESSSSQESPVLTTGTGLFQSSFEDIDAPIGRRRGNEGVVRVGVNVPTRVTSEQIGNNGVLGCSITQISTAGLVLGARVQKIDDNGFVSFSLSPQISAVERELSAGALCTPISILRVRRLDTGVVRVRDGQTLILTGVISDFDRAVVSKWPILGDIPVVGQFFRATSNNRGKRELVIMVTPRIINDTEGGTYGYGFEPSSRESRQFMNPSGTSMPSGYPQP